jgi:hypothetical protein
MNRLKNRLYRNQLVTESTCTVKMVNESLYRTSIVNGTEVVQPYQTPFTPKGDQTFIPNEIPLHRLKIDNEIDPNPIKETWLDFLSDNKQDRMQYPLISFLLENHILAKKDEDMELSVSYKGIRVAPTPGVAGLSSGSMNGFEKVIDDAKLSLINPMTTIITGALSTDPLTFCNQVEAWYAQINPKHRTLPNMLVRMSESLALRYKQGRRIKYNMYYSQVSTDMIIEDFPNAKVVGLPGMQGKQRIWATTKENAVMLYRIGTNGIMVKEFKPRVISIYTDWSQGLGLLDNNEAYCNDL